MSDGEGSHTIEEVVNYVIHVRNDLRAFRVRDIIAGSLVNLEDTSSLVENSVEAMIKNHLRELTFHLEHVG